MALAGRRRANRSGPYEPLRPWGPRCSARSLSV